MATAERGLFHAACRTRRAGAKKRDVRPQGGYARGVRFVCDFDGIAYPFVSAVAAHPSGAGLSLETCWEWETPIHVVGEDEWPAALDRALSYETMAQVGLFADFAPAILSLRRRGVEPLVRTHRSEARTEDVRRILADYGLGWLSVERMSPKDKVDYCLAEGIGVLVDDFPETIAEAHKAGISVLSLRFPYNRQVLEELEVVNASSWRELEQLLHDTLTLHEEGHGPRQATK